MERNDQAVAAGERFGRFVGNVVKGILMGLGLIFLAILIFGLF